MLLRSAAGAPIFELLKLVLADWPLLKTFVPVPGELPSFGKSKRKSLFKPLTPFEWIEGIALIADIPFRLVIHEIRLRYSLSSTWRRSTCARNSPFS